MDFYGFSNEDGDRKSEYVQNDGSHVSEAGYQALTRYIRGLNNF